MPSDAEVLAALVTAGAVTVALRALPFLVIGPLRSSRLVRWLGFHLPAGIMVILTTYTLRTVPLRPWPHGLPEALGIAATLALHRWRHQAPLSILGGTLAYVALTSWVFA